MTRMTSRRRALAVAGIAAAATLAIGGAALAAGGDDAPSGTATVAATDSPSPDDTASPTDSPTTDDTTNPGAAVGSDLAVGIALNATGGGTVTEVEAEFEHGRAAWKVRIVKDGVRYDVYVDANTGEVIRFRNQVENGGNAGDDRRGHGGSGRDHAEDD